MCRFATWCRSAFSIRLPLGRHPDAIYAASHSGDRFGVPIVAPIGSPWRSAFRAANFTRATLQLEILALRQQLQILEQSRGRRLRLTRFDRLFWVGLSQVWPQWRAALVIVKPETVIAPYSGHMPR